MENLMNRVSFQPVQCVFSEDYDTIIVFTHLFHIHFDQSFEHGVSHPKCAVSPSKTYDQIEFRYGRWMEDGQSTPFPNKHGSANGFAFLSAQLGGAFNFFEPLPCMATWSHLTDILQRGWNQWATQYFGKNSMCQHVSTQHASQRLFQRQQNQHRHRERSKIRGNKIHRQRLGLQTLDLQHSGGKNPKCHIIASFLNTVWGECQGPLFF